MGKKNKYLSASRIKTLESCTWNYWANYHLKVPQSKHPGASRGTVCHIIFELLLNKKHKKYMDEILEKKTISKVPVIKRLVIKLLKKEGCCNRENYDLCNEMIYVGLNTDFLCGGGDLQDPEYRFELESNNPDYKALGFIDKISLHHSEDTIKITDYKSSKRKFAKAELSSNFQAMMYTLAAKDKWPEFKNVLIEFVFLRFPKQPLQQITVEKEQLAGFEYYMEEVYHLVNNFDEKAAKMKYAAHNPREKWLCKAGATWRCPFLDKVEYHALLDEDGEILKTDFKNVFTPKKGERVEKRTYEGCPAFEHERNSSEDEDEFGF
jgi:hypothetical protein